MKEETYDKFLIGLALLGPLLLVALAKWQDSLITWYEPWNGDGPRYFAQGFVQDVQALPVTSAAGETILLLLADKSCPCARASQDILEQAMAQAKRKDLRLVVMDVHASPAKTAPWSRVLRQIPATPTLLVVEAGRLRYSGPVNTGNLCTTGVRKILGLAALDTATSSPMINRLAKGCYCPLKTG